MTRSTMLTALLTLTALCGTANADDQRPTERLQLPQGRTLEAEGVEYKCFTLDEYKVVAHLVVDYNWLWEHTLKLERANALLTAKAEIQAERVSLWQSQVDTLERERDYLSKLFDEEHGLRLKIENRDRALGWIPWALVVAESIAIGAIGLYAGAN